MLLLKKLYIRTVNFSCASSMLTHSLLIYLLKRSVIYVPICFLIMRISQRVQRNLSLRTFCLWLLRNCILCLMVFLINKRRSGHGFASWTFYGKFFLVILCLNSAFHNYFNTCHTNVSFSYEQENVEVSRVKEKFVTTVYRAPTSGGVYTHFKVSWRN